MVKWAEEEAKRNNLSFPYAEGFQRIVLLSEQERPPEAVAVEAQAES
jgi:hypothetical protein